MNNSANPLARFFGVLIKSQTYLNLLYLLLAFPLGLVYLIFFIVGIALGLPLTIILVGLVILAFVGLGWWVFATFERLLAIWLLRIDIPPMSKPGPKPEGVWDTITSLLSNPVTWKSLVYLVLKPILGVFALVALVTLGGISLALMLSPLLFWWNPVTVELIGQSTWVIDNLFEAGIALLIGVFFALISLHILNYLAYVYGLFARMMLGNQRPTLADYTREGLLEDAEHVARPYKIDAGDVSPAMDESLAPEVVEGDLASSTIEGEPEAAEGISEPSNND